MVKTITTQEAQILLKEFLETRSKEDQRALCCLLGSYIGDNLGNYNEFTSSISEEELEEAMTMPGNGAHNLVPGQSTDDTELATSMAYGIIENSDPNILDCNLISKYYALWLQSPPFDLGMTIGSALSINRRENISITSTAEQCKEALIAQKNRYSTNSQNRHSQSNGGCMRISPLCVYLSKQTDQNEIRRIVTAEQSLTHCCKPALEAAYVYVRLVTNLIKGATAKEAYADLKSYFENECQEEDVKDWWVKKEKKCEFDNAVQSMGWIKHALTQCFVVLKRLADQEGEEDQSFKKDAYKLYMKQVLSLCGDSDTNAAIVGGMLGAYLTLEQFPGDYLYKLVMCDLEDQTNSQLYHPRHPMYNPRNCIYLCTQLLNKASNNPKIEIIDEILTKEIINQIVKENDDKMKLVNQAYKNKLQEDKNITYTLPKKIIDQTEANEEDEKKDNNNNNKIGEKGSLIAYFQKEKEQQMAQESEEIIENQTENDTQLPTENGVIEEEEEIQQGQTNDIEPKNVEDTLQEQDKQIQDDEI